MSAYPSPILKKKNTIPTIPAPPPPPPPPPNMALMTDNIAILEEEVELTKKIFPEIWKGPDSSFYGKIKKTFSTNALTSAKSNPACYIKKITNHCI